MPRWTDCIVAASGPSLTHEVSEQCWGQNVLAVNDAYRMMHYAKVLYACDAAWWDVHKGCPDFRGEKWSSHGDEIFNNKLACAEKYGLNLIRGSEDEGFSFDPTHINYGSNSGFQGINLALLFGAKRILLVGFDMRVTTKAHFFGEHPPSLYRNTSYERFIPQFERAAKKLPPDIQIINCTPGSALTCFPQMELADALPIAA